MRRIGQLWIAISLVAAAALAADEASYERELAKWRSERVERLKSPTGWLTVVGLEWLAPGSNSVGSATGSGVRLPASAPATVGTIELAGEKLTFQAAAGAGVTVAGKPVERIELLSDRHESPTLLQVGSVTFFVIERGAKKGVRIRDSEAAARKNFRGIDGFPVDGKWRIEAKWEAYPQPKKVMTPTVIGVQSEELAPGVAVFELAGKTCRLEPVLEDPDADELFFVFGDLSNGRTTYGGGRFLYAPLPKDGKILLDFNRAYNPPCVFTDFATCPMPRKENRLPVTLEAGERSYRGGASH